MKKKLLAMLLCVCLASIGLEGAEVHEPAVTVGGITHFTQTFNQ